MTPIVPGNTRNVIFSRVVNFLSPSITSPPSAWTQWTLALAFTSTCYDIVFRS